MTHHLTYSPKLMSSCAAARAVCSRNVCGNLIVTGDSMHFSWCSDMGTTRSEASHPYRVTWEVPPTQSKGMTRERQRRTNSADQRRLTSGQANQPAARVSESKQTRRSWRKECRGLHRCSAHSFVRDVSENAELTISKDRKMECAVDTTSCDPLAAALAIATLIKSLSNQLIAFLLGCVWSDICGLVSKERNPNQVESLSDQLNYLKRIPHEGKNNRSHHAPPRPVVSLRQSQPDCRAASSWGKHRRSHDVNRVSSRGRFKQRQNPWLASISTEQNFRAIHRCNDLFVGAKWIQPKCKRDAKNPCPAIAAPQSHSPAGYAGSLWLAQSDQCAEDAFALISNISGLLAAGGVEGDKLLPKIPVRRTIWRRIEVRDISLRRAALVRDLGLCKPTV